MILNCLSLFLPTAGSQLKKKRLSKKLMEKHGSMKHGSKGVWSSDETEKLKQNILNYCDVHIQILVNF